MVDDAAGLVEQRGEAVGEEGAVDGADVGSPVGEVAVVVVRGEDLGVGGGDAGGGLVSEIESGAGGRET